MAELTRPSSMRGWGVDLPADARPGKPEEQRPPHPVGNAHWLVPDVQLNDGVPLVGAKRSLTPVYSTANPPRGLSGLMRRAAYRVPDYKPRRWMLLILADRVDVFEHNLAPMTKLVLGAASLAAGILAFRALRRAL